MFIINQEDETTSATHTAFWTFYRFFGILKNSANKIVRIEGF